MLRLFKPEIYQGNKSLKSYFEGWYFKMVSEDETKVYSFIPGISLNPSDPHAFIQFIDGITGNTEYVRYSIQDFSYDKEQFRVWVGNSFFSAEKIVLDIKENKFTVKAELYFRENNPFPSTWFSPGIMGWYSFVPFMECKHGVVSMNHYVYGNLNINRKLISFNGGKSYIEKDWGKSFPAAWIWLQCNNFDHPGASMMMSVAKIPWLGSYFMGFLGFFHLDAKTWVFASYNNSGLELKGYNDQKIFIDLKSKNALMSLEIERRKAGELRAPQKGMMNRMIKESIDSKVKVAFFDGKGDSIFNQTGRRAGLEVTSNIFELLEKEGSRI